uniref:Lysozyme g n=1 Tax=Gasterosteus aculeatus TaxID=69293 RepID=G3Q6N5_GASAC
MCRTSLHHSFYIYWRACKRASALFSKGEKASHTLAQTDKNRMEKYRSKINTVGAKYGIDPALIAAIISRETRAGNCLQGGWGDGGNAWGLMQVVK